MRRSYVRLVEHTRGGSQRQTDGLTLGGKVEAIQAVEEAEHVS